MALSTAPDGATRKFIPVGKADVQGIGKELSILVQDSSFMRGYLQTLVKSSSGSGGKKEEQQSQRLIDNTEILRKRFEVDKRHDGPKRQKEDRRNKALEDRENRRHRESLDISQRSASKMEAAYNRSSDSLRKHIEKLSPIDTLKKINDDTDRAMKLVSSMSGDQSAFLKTIVEDNERNQSRAMNDILEALKEEYKTLSEDNRKLQTEEGQLRLKQLVNGINEIVKEKGGSRGGRGRGKKDEDSLEGNWFQRQKKRIFGKAFEGFLGSDFVQGALKFTEAITAKDFGSIEEGIRNKKEAQKEEQAAQKDILEKQLKINEYQELLGPGDSGNEDGLGETRKSPTDKVFEGITKGAEILFGEDDSDTAADPDQTGSGESTEATRKKKNEEKKAKYAPSTGNVRKYNPEIFWLERMTKKEDDQTQNKLNSVRDAVITSAQVSGGLMKAGLLGLAAGLTSVLVSEVIKPENALAGGWASSKDIQELDKKVQNDKYKDFLLKVAPEDLKDRMTDLYSTHGDTYRKKYKDKKVARVFSSGYGYKNIIVDLHGQKDPEDTDEIDAVQTMWYINANRAVQETKDINVAKKFLEIAKDDKYFEKFTTDNRGYYQEHLKTSAEESIKRLSKGEKTLSEEAEPEIEKWLKENSPPPPPPPQPFAPPPPIASQSTGNWMGDTAAGFVNQKKLINDNINSDKNVGYFSTPPPPLSAPPSPPPPLSAPPSSSAPRSTRLAQADLALAKDANFEILKAQLSEQQKISNLLTELKTTLATSKSAGTVQNIVQTIERISATNIMQSLEGVR